MHNWIRKDMIISSILNIPNWTVADFMALKLVNLSSSFLNGFKVLDLWVLSCRSDFMHHFLTRSDLHYIRLNIDISHTD